MESASDGSAQKRLRPRPWGRLTERIESTERLPNEGKRALPLVFAVASLAAASALGVARIDLVGDQFAFVAAILLAIGFSTELLAFYEKNRSASGSIAQIPYTAAAILLPDIRIVVGLIVSQALAQVWHRRTPIKAVFNVGQHTLAFSGGLLVFRSLASPTVTLNSFGSTLLDFAVPTAAMVLCISAINTLAVAAVISAISRQNIWQLWLTGVRPASLASAVTILFAIYLAWLSGALGVFGTIGMVVPLLAVRQLSRTTVELTKVTEELLDLMVAAIEARDPYTSGHSKRVARASRIIASAMQLKPEQVERVEISALLHDVGKIDEQFARILAKEGRLTPEEWEIMKRHPVRSAQLVSMLSSLKDIVPSVRHHHENWDGTGYPDGIAGESIPLGSRIIMFADTLDAITTDRPYRKALDPEEARREFVKFRGKQFDPSVCDVVVSEPVWRSLYDQVRAAHAETAPSEPSKQAVA
jgi:HD-GYP domain-containing protein (c-di-GMP phosphodiesterase class II)